MQTDFIITNHGSLVAVFPSSAAGQEWADEYLSSALRHVGAYVVEPRYILPILDGIESDGLTIQ